MLPPKVTNGALGLLRSRVNRLVRLLNLFAQKERPPPLNVVAVECRLIGDVAWLLAPDSMADALATKHDLAARKAFRVCVWDGECNADATTDDGLCAAHAEEQKREDAETEGLDALLSQAAAEQGGTDAG